MLQQPKKPTRRVYICVSREMNYRREVHPQSREMRIVINSMSSKPARLGGTEFGWFEDEGIACINLADPMVESLLASMGVVSKPDPTKPADHPDNLARAKENSVDTLIRSEMDQRRAKQIKLSPGTPAYLAFQADFCDEKGVLIDLTKVDRSHLYVQAAGFHRLSYAYSEAHALVVEENVKIAEHNRANPDDLQPLKEWTDIIPVIPSSFNSQTEMVQWESMENVRGQGKIIQTKLDLCYIAVSCFSRFGSETAFRRAQGDVGIATAKRAKSGQGVDDDDPDSTKDAGSLARFAYKVAELHHKFPRLEVMKCLTVNAKDPDFVPLSALSISPKDWEASIPTILQLTDMAKLEDYVKRRKGVVSDICLEVRDSKKPWDEARVMQWWETRKPNKNGGIVSSGIVVKAEPKKDMIAVWESSHPSRLIQKAMEMTKEETADTTKACPNYDFFDKNAEVLNNITDVIENTSYATELSEIAKMVTQLVSVHGNPQPILTECIAKLHAAGKDAIAARDLAERQRLEAAAKAAEDAERPAAEKHSQEYTKAVDATDTVNTTLAGVAQAVETVPPKKSKKS